MRFVGQIHALRRLKQPATAYHKRVVVKPRYVSRLHAVKRWASVLHTVFVHRTDGDRATFSADCVHEVRTPPGFVVR